MRMKRHATGIAIFVGAIAYVASSGTVWAQVTADDLAVLEQRAIEAGWTFRVGLNEATQYSLDELCGFTLENGWWKNAPFDPCSPRSIPPAFDWRDVSGCPPIRNQGGCGSCWAFATVGALECAIRIQDGIDRDLSEQWLVSCNQSGWSCAGGSTAHDYHMWQTDPCGGTGAVPEEAFPYVAADVPCDCPYTHEYLIESWAYIGTPFDIPDTAAIKQAILDHGPVMASLYVNSAFQAYSGGVFNACENNMGTNHSVVLVGWDDNMGTEGVWILRNSWGTDWGDRGYMYIEYGCSLIGSAASYVDYPGYDPMDVLPHRGMLAAGRPGGPFTPCRTEYTLTNDGPDSLQWVSIVGDEWLSVVPSTGTLGPGAETRVNVCYNPATTGLAAGAYDGTVSFVNAATGLVRQRPITLWVGSRADVPVDTAESVLTAELCIEGYCDQDTSHVAGATSVLLDDVDAPGTITLFDFEHALTEDLVFNISWGILGAFDCTIADMVARPVDAGGPSGPFPVAGGMFTLLDQAQDMEGMLDYDSWGLPCYALQSMGVPCVGSYDLDGLQTYGGQTEGSIASADRVVDLTLHNDLALAVEGMLSFHLYGPVTGTTLVPEVGYGDGEQDGDVDLADLSLGAGCLTGPRDPGDPMYDEGCQWFDFDMDYDMDLADVAAFQAVFTGSR